MFITFIASLITSLLLWSATQIHQADIMRTKSDIIIGHSLDKSVKNGANAVATAAKEACFNNEDRCFQEGLTLSPDQIKPFLGPINENFISGNVQISGLSNKITFTYKSKDFTFTIF